MILIKPTGPDRARGRDRANLARSVDRRAQSRDRTPAADSRPRPPRPPPLRRRISVFCRVSGRRPAATLRPTSPISSTLSPPPAGHLRSPLRPRTARAPPASAEPDLRRHCSSRHHTPSRRSPRPGEFTPPLDSGRRRRDAADELRRSSRHKSSSSAVLERRQPAWYTSIASPHRGEAVDAAAARCRRRKRPDDVAGGGEVNGRAGKRVQTRPVNPNPTR